MQIIRKAAAKVSLDGPEVVRDYCRTDKIWFGTSELLPGQTGGVDPGHPISHETFFRQQRARNCAEPGDRMLL